MITRLRKSLGIGSTSEADVDLWRVPSGTRWVASSVDRFFHGKCPPQEPLDIWAFRAVNAALSDLACAGAADPAVQLDLQVPRNVGETELDLIAAGVLRSLQINTATLLNGCNTTFGPVALTVAVRGTGSSGAKAPGRSGARPGDLVWISRLPGRFNAALDLVNEQLPNDFPPWVGSALLGGLPEFKIGRELLASGAVTALIDANDCVLLCLEDLARASMVAIDLDWAAVRRIADMLPECTGVPLFLGPPSGDLALVFTSPEKDSSRIRAVFTRMRRQPWLLGRCVQGRGSILVEGVQLPHELSTLAVRKWVPSATFIYPTEVVRSAALHYE